MVTFSRKFKNNRTIYILGGYADGIGHVSGGDLVISGAEPDVDVHVGECQDGGSGFLFDGIHDCGVNFCG